jgi:predicted DNA-binding transcriptional regulator YafY
VRADRLLAMMLLLQARGRLTARTLADELEVSVRTVYRDVEALNTAGIPVVAEAGHGGGYQLLEGFQSPLNGLTPEEARALLLLGTPQPLRDLGLSPVWQAAQRKLASAIGPSDGRREGLLHVHLDVQAWFPAQEDIRHLPTVALAIRQRRRLALVYGRREVTVTQRIIEPLGLVNKAGIWYVVTRTGECTVVYRVGRVQSAEVLESTFVMPRDFDLAEAWSAWSAEFVNSRPLMRVTLRVSPAVLPILPEVFGDQVRGLLAAAGPPDKTGWQTVTLTFEHPSAACHRLLGFGAEVEVLEPEVVRSLLVETAEATLAFYRRRDGLCSQPPLVATED